MSKEDWFMYVLHLLYPQKTLLHVLVYRWPSSKGFFSNHSLRVFSEISYQLGVNSPNPCFMFHHTHCSD
jgi:hypothetical protein